MAFSNLLSLLAIAMAAVSVVEATQAMHRPDNYKQPPRVFNTSTDPQIQSIHKRATGKTQFAYFTNWGIYGANFQPTDIVAKDLTTILYSFADVSADTGSIALTDSYADVEVCVYAIGLTYGF